ncbi:MAG: PEP-utilizing enzyme [Halieaceae bacterium]|nr:PEP-utilizing enzyme [Halieaceae bacterium]
MKQIVWFHDEEINSIDLVGGKGTNLGRLAKSGFDVPEGFVVTAGAYSEFLVASGIKTEIAQLIETLNAKDADDIEKRSLQVRMLIEQKEIPSDLVANVSEAYGRIGIETYVAVRSSGIAEDLGDASFAGMHDTYLDISGLDHLLTALKRCWASLWTARAVSYRESMGFDHFESPIAVVIQRMVQAKVAGVVFTANPVNAATNEIVVDAGWGLGESVVSGMTMPDQFVVDTNTLIIKAKTLGTKEVQIIRDPGSEAGVKEIETAPEQRSIFCLNDEQVSTLSKLSCKVEDEYDGLPQDIEWAMDEHGKFYLLQSRPVTGVELFWGEDLAFGNSAELEKPTTVWTSSWADEQWTGAITPLMFTFRSECFSKGAYRSARLCGVSEVVDADGNPKEPVFKFYRSKAYYNSNVERLMLENITLPIFRDYPHVLDHVAPQWHDEVKAAPLKLADVLAMHLGAIDSGDRAVGPYKYFDCFYEWYNGRADKVEGLSQSEIEALSDSDLKSYIDTHIREEIDYVDELWFGFYVYSRDAFCALQWILENWYDGDTFAAMGALMSGTTERTPTTVENLQLWKLAEKIRASSSLKAIFEKSSEAAFFDDLQATDEGKRFLEEHGEFVQRYPHRGHEDRDFYFERRGENPGLDYGALLALINSENVSNPEENEERVNAERERFIQEVVDNITEKQLGGLKAGAFKVLFDWISRFLVFRDQLRYASDICLYQAKRGYVELGKRLCERNLIKDENDYYFLGMQELFDFFDGNAKNALVRAKIDGRKRDFERCRSGQADLPTYIQNNRAAEFSNASEEEAEDSSLQGIGTSRGAVTGRAKVIRNIKDINRVEKDDILITHSTDPGWTPVFLIIKGLVLETGGLLAHGSTLSREYGLPAVQYPKAMDVIPDGALVRVDGNTGKIKIIDPSETHNYE